jgi:hypothetical protein
MDMDIPRLDSAMVAMEAMGTMVMAMVALADTVDMATITTVMAICIMAAFQWLEAIMAPVVLPWPEAR